MDLGPVLVIPGPRPPQVLPQSEREHNLQTSLISLMYGHSWNGLRVRVGIHCGYGEIRYDPVTKRYDYYGTVVNTAARIESVCHGGQIGISQVAPPLCARDYVLGVGGL